MGGIRAVGAARIGLVAVVVAVAGGCWPAPGAGPDRRAHNPFETEITTETVAALDVAWTANIGGAVTDPVVSNRGVHVTSRIIGDFPSDIFAFGMDGQPLWSRRSELDEFTSRGSIVSGGDRVAVSLFDNEGEATATRWFSAADGTPLTAPERHLVLDGLRGSQAVFAWRPFVGWPDGGLFVGDVDDPSERWGGLISNSQALQQPLTIGRRYVYHAGFGLSSSGPGALQVAGVRAFPLVDGSTDCEFDLACPVWATQLVGSATAPVIGDGETSIYVGTSAGNVHALDAATGEIRWSAAVGSAVTHPPALADGRLFVPTTAGNLVALAAAGCGSATCTPLWTATTGSEITEQPAVAGGVVFTASANGALRAFPAAGCGAATCASLWSASTGSGITGAPAVTAGRLFVGTGDGRLIVYRPVKT